MRSGIYLDPARTVYYNPCSPISDCGDGSVCLAAGGQAIEYGSAYTGIFVTDGGEVSLHYTSTDGPMRLINLRCDQDNERLFKVNSYINLVINASLYSKCACDGGCNVSRSLQCILADDGCFCTVKESGKTYDLRELDKKYSPMKVTDHNNYTYYYRPCSGLEYDVTDCQGAVCQLSPNWRPLSLGAVRPASASVSSSTGDLVIHYVGGDEGRCDDYL